MYYLLLKQATDILVNSSLKDEIFTKKGTYS